MFKITGFLKAIIEVAASFIQNIRKLTIIHKAIKGNFVKKYIVWNET